VSEDRFEDLGEPRKPTAAERFEREDRVNPEPDDPRRRPEVPRPGNPYAWVVGILLLMGIGVLLLTTALPNTGAGLEGPARGKLLPDFAAPLTSSNLDGDPNVCQRGGRCNEQSGSQPACELRAKGVFNVCVARRKALVMTFVFDRGADCNPQVDRVERMQRSFPDVNFVVVYYSNESRGDIERIVRRRGWTMPVAYVGDSAVVNLYGVGGCPTTVFANAGGRVRTTKLGPLTEGQLRAQVRALRR
jgi:hypothetical protein